MKTTLVFIFLTFTSGITSYSQNRIFTKTGIISFKAGTAVEDIDAINKSATGVIDLVSGQVEFAVLIKGFEFRRALMQEHFNENYMESEQFPKALFKGMLEDVAKIDFKKDGRHDASIRGTLQIHGMINEIKVPIIFTIVRGQISGTTSFLVNIAEYGIKIPGAVKDKISSTVSVDVAGDFKPM